MQVAPLAKPSPKVEIEAQAGDKQLISARITRAKAPLDYGDAGG